MQFHKLFSVLLLTTIEPKPLVAPTVPLKVVESVVPLVVTTKDRAVEPLSRFPENTTLPLVPPIKVVS